MKFSFLHVADLHLDRQFVDILNNTNNSSVENLFKNGMSKVLDNIINLAIQKKVDFILFAGDTFDSETHDFKAKQTLKKALQKLDNANIKTILICGNHDPLNSYQKETFNFSENSNIKIVGLNTPVKTQEIIYKDNLPISIIHAMSFETENYYDNPTKQFLNLTLEEKKLFNIGLLHCDLNASSVSHYAPCNISDLKNLEYDYWALGHIHKQEIYSEEIIYAGTPQGRNSKESGVHGVRYIEVDTKTIIKNELIPVDVLRYENINIDISKAEDTTSAYDIIENVISDVFEKKSCDFYSFRLILTGNIKFYSDLNEDFYLKVEDDISSRFNDKVCISQIINNTNISIDEELLQSDTGITGAIYNIAKNISLVDDTFEKLKITYSKFLNQCEFNDKELEEFKNEVINISQEKCMNICNNVYDISKNEDNK